MTRVVDGKTYTLSHVTSEHAGVHVEHWVDVHGKALQVVCEEKQDVSELDYRELRRRAYEQEIPIGEQLDAILKTLNYLQMKKKINATASLDDVIGKWLNIKKRYPKG